MAEDQNRTYQDKFMLRLPDGMREQIKAAADRSGRSMNAEIVDRLALTLDYVDGDSQSLLHKLDRHEDEIFKLDDEIRNLTFRLEHSARLNEELRAVADRFYLRMNMFLVFLSEHVEELPDDVVLFLNQTFTDVAKEQGRLDADATADKTAEVAAKAIREMRNNYVHRAAASVRRKFKEAEKETS